MIKFCDQNRFEVLLLFLALLYVRLIDRGVRYVAPGAA